MTSPITKPEPIYIEIPDQRAFKAASIAGNYTIFVFAFASIFAVNTVPLVWYLIAAIVACALSIAGLFVAKKAQSNVRGKLRSEFNQQTGLTLPSTFDPQKLPSKAVPEKVLVVDGNGVAQQWTAARNGTFFRFAPA